MNIDWPLVRPYLAVVTDVHDGDTIKVDLDLGLKIGLKNYPLRLNGCNAWELSTDAGKAARDHLKALLPVGTPLVLETIKDYKYGGEYVADVFLPATTPWTNLVATLIDQQWLAAWDGNGKAPTPPWPRTVA